MDCKPSRFLHPWDFPGKNTGVGYHFLLQIFQIQQPNLDSLQCRRILQSSEPPGKPAFLRHSNCVVSMLNGTEIQKRGHKMYMHGVFPGGSDGIESTCNAGDSGLIPRLGRSPGEGNGNPLQYSCLENPMDRGGWPATVHRVTKSQTGLSN